MNFLGAILPNKTVLWSNFFNIIGTNTHHKELS